MSKTNKYVSADIKKQILERLRSDGIPVAQLAEEHGLSGRTIYGWLSKGATAQPTWLELNKLKGWKRCQVPFLGRPGFRRVISRPNFLTTLSIQDSFPNGRFLLTDSLIYSSSFSFGSILIDGI